MSLAAFEKIGFNIDDIKASLGGAWDKTKEIANNDYVKYPLLGAGIGGLGMGAASAIGGHGDPENPESSKDRFKRIGGSALKGATLGGGAGLGYAALQRAATNTLAGPSAEEGPKGDTDASLWRRLGAGAGAAAGARGELKGLERTTASEVEHLKGEQTRNQATYDAGYKGDAPPVGLDSGNLPGWMAGKLKSPSGPLTQPPAPSNVLGGPAAGVDANIEQYIQDELKRNNFGGRKDPSGFLEKFKEFHAQSTGKSHSPSTVDMVRDTGNIFNNDVASTYADKIRDAQPGMMTKGYRGLIGAGKGAGLGWLATDLAGRGLSAAFKTPPAERTNIKDLQ